MGVPGLWDILRPTGKHRALAHVAVEDGFVPNANGVRAYRLGIDASIWFFHALGGREGENPELRTLFFRCARLLAMPYLPIFVFDGPGRPKIKRGKAVGRKEHWLVNSLRDVLEAFGFECRTAPGEAEAELAFLNRIGVIDAVLSDDVDCFVFGACTVMRNGSATLTGNSHHATDDPQHVYIYRAQDIATHPKVSLSRGGLILIALLSGGDYDGIEGCGTNTAYALARAGLGDALLDAALAGDATLAGFLPVWRTALRHELRTNASGYAPRKSPTLATRITDAFPSLEVLRCYTHPLTSERIGKRDLGLGALWTRQVDVSKLAHVCERFFEWGVEDTVVKRFRTVIWPGAVLRVLLQAARERDVASSVQGAQDTHGALPDTPSKKLARTLQNMGLLNDEESSAEEDYDTTLSPSSLLRMICGTRRHTSTDNMLEYRVEVRPRLLVAQVRAGMQGLRVVTQDSARIEEDADGDGNEEGEETRRGKWVDPESVLRVWMPAVVVEHACPKLVRAFEAREAAKVAKKAAKSGGKRREAESQEKGQSSGKLNAKSKSRSKKQVQESEDESENIGELTKLKKVSGDSELTGLKSRRRICKTKDASMPTYETASDKDPFLAPLPPWRPTVPTTARPTSAPRPFPVPIDNEFAAEADPIPHHKHLSAETSDSDSAVSHLTRFQPDLVEKRLVPNMAKNKTRPPAPSQSARRPLQDTRVPSIHRDVIVILSDSDSESPSLPHKKSSPLRGSTMIPKHADIIDLT